MPRARVHRTAKKRKKNRVRNDDELRIGTIRKDRFEMSGSEIRWKTYHVRRLRFNCAQIVKRPERCIDRDRIERSHWQPAGRERFVCRSLTPVCIETFPE